MGKDGGAKTYNHHGTIAGVVCEGPIDSLVAIVIDGKEVWPKAKAWKVGNTYELGDLKRWNGRTYEYINAGSSVASDANRPDNASYWSEYVMAATGDYADISCGVGRNLRIYWGTQTQTVDTDLTAAGNDYGEEHPDYRGLCYVVLKRFRMGQERNASVNLQLIVRRKPQQSVITGDASNLTDAQANLVAAAAELLTSDNGVGISASLLDSTSFQAAADYLHDRADVVASSPVLNEQDTMRSVADKLSEIGDFFLRFNPSTGLIEAGAYVHNEAPSSYTTLTIADLEKTPKFSPEGWASGRTRAIISFRDRNRLFKDTSDQAVDLRAFKVLGEHRPMTISSQYITRRTQALLFAAEKLKTDGRPQCMGSIVVRRERGMSIRPGDYVRLDIDLEPGGAQLLQYFRVVDKTTPPFGGITFTLDAIENLSPEPVNAYETPVTDEDEEIPEVSNLRVIPTPPKMATRTDSVMILAERPGDNLIGFDAYFDTNTAGTFTRLEDIRHFAQRATLRSDHNSSTLTLQVNAPAQVDTDLFEEQPGTISANDDELLAILVEKDGANIKEDSDGYTYVEVCSIVAQSLVSSGNYDITVLRARQGTTARAFTSANAEVWLIRREDLVELHHGDFATLLANRAVGATPDTGYFRLQTFTDDNQIELADCTSRAFRFPRRTQAGPKLTLTAPVGSTTNAIAPFPATVTVTGTATDDDSNLIAYRVAVKKSGGSEVVVEENTFAPCESVDFSVPVLIDSTGTHYITVTAFDNAGLVTSTTIVVTASAGTSKVATPQWYYMGKRISNGATMRHNTVLELRCATDGATIFWRTGTSGAWTTYDPENPTTWPNVPGASSSAGRSQAYATKASFTDSSITEVLKDI